MKSKDKKELHKKSIQELRNLVSEAKDELALLKLDKVQNKLKNTSQLPVKRKEVAQILTIMRLKELVEMQPKRTK